MNVCLYVRFYHQNFRVYFLPKIAFIKLFKNNKSLKGRNLFLTERP
jgi:hypothetical protein